MLSCICDLPPLVRFSYTNMVTNFIMTCTSPNLNEYLKKHSQEFEFILKNGIIIDGVGKIKFKVVGIICDTPARSKVLNTIGFNGYFGCLFCLNPGKQIDRKHVYLYSTTTEIRTNDIYNKQVNIATKKKETYRGIKGRCYLSKHFCIPDDVLLDVMHLCFLGNMKRLLSLWTESKYSKELWYLGIILKKFQYLVLSFII